MKKTFTKIFRLFLWGFVVSFGFSTGLYLFVYARNYADPGEVSSSDTLTVGLRNQVVESLFRKRDGTNDISFTAGNASVNAPIEADHIVNKAYVDAKHTCPAGFTTVGPYCIDLTCRGPGEVEDTSINTRQGASDRCDELGGRLCTVSEIISTKGMGCGFDAERIAGYYELLVRRGRYGGVSTYYLGDYYTYPENPRLIRDDDASTNTNIDGFYCCY